MLQVLLLIFLILVQTQTWSAACEPGVMCVEPVTVDSLNTEARDLASGKSNGPPVQGLVLLQTPSFLFIVGYMFYDRETPSLDYYFYNIAHLDATALSSRLSKIKDKGTFKNKKRFWGYEKIDQDLVDDMGLPVDDEVFSFYQTMFPNIY